MNDHETTQDHIVTSVETDKIYSALVAAQSEITDVPMRGRNPHFRSKYATLPDVLKVARPVLSKHGLAVISAPFAEEGKVFGTAVRIIHQSGQYIQMVGRVSATKGTAQELGSVCTYLRRYSLTGALNISGDEDDDGEAAEGRGKGKKARKKTEAQEYQQMGEDMSTLVTQKPGRPGFISEPQRKRMFAITYEAERDGGAGIEILREYLKSKHNIESTNDIPKDKYDEICKWIEGSAGNGE